MTLIFTIQTHFVSFGAFLVPFLLAFFDKLKRTQMNLAMKILNNSFCGLNVKRLVNRLAT